MGRRNALLGNSTVSKRRRRFKKNSQEKINNTPVSYSPIFRTTSFNSGNNMRPNVSLGETGTQSSSSDDGNQEFHSPDAPPNYTDNSRIVNPFGASTSRQAKVQPTARKKTGAAANRRFSATPKRRESVRAQPTRVLVSAKQRNLKMLREIRKLQNRTDLLVPKLPFARVVREIMRKYSAEINRVTTDALLALQESSEMYLTQQLHDAYLLTLHRARVTLSVKDMELLRRLRDLMH